jgi:hypothetical protein
LGVKAAVTSENGSTIEHLDSRTVYRTSVPRAAWRIIPQIDKNPRIIKFAESISGKILLLALFGILLDLTFGLPTRVLNFDHHLGYFVITLLAATCAFAGKYRWWVIPFATWMILYREGFLFSTGLTAIVATREGVESQNNFRVLHLLIPLAVFLLSAGVIYSARRFRDTFFFRRPIVCLIALFVAMVLVAESSAMHGMQRVILWSFVGTFVRYFWFLGYAVLEVARESPPILAQLGMFHPFWGSTNVPFGKNVTYLRKFESKGSHELSITQLKGLKLALWLAVLQVAEKCFAVSTQYLHIPTFEESFAAHLAGAAYPWYVGWVSLISDFFEDLLSISIWGGVIIACARMSGFRLLRNTYRPLESRTIAEFWNRYYFYFKELLVDFFFYPTFLRCFRKHKRLRTFFATFMAACVGNLIYHFMRDIYLVADLGVAKAVVGFESYALYALILSVGIAVSQMRADQPNASSWWLFRLTDSLRVGAFFCILHIFDATSDRAHSLWERLSFLFYLFGVHIWI